MRVRRSTIIYWIGAGGVLYNLFRHSGAIFGVFMSITFVGLYLMIRGRDRYIVFRGSPLRVLLTVGAIILTILASFAFALHLFPLEVMGLIYHISPAMADRILVNAILRGGVAFWPLAIIAGILWYVRSRAK